MADRTEAPTPRRLEEARRRGQVAMSTEVNTALIVLAGSLLLAPVGQQMAAQIMQIAHEILGGLATTELTSTALFSGGLEVALRLGLAMAPLLGGLVLVGIVASVAQSGFLISAERLKPRLSKINPIAGAKNIFSSRGAAELAKAVLKIALVGYVAYTAIREAIPLMVGTPNDQISYFMSSWQRLALDLGKNTGLTLLVLGAADYAFQRRQWLQSLRMTRHELLEEMRESQGDPFLRSRLRQRQRQFAMNRMMADVPKADVVVTNPTHVAVALRYDPSKASAPVVVAKGERLVAERIKEVAREHGVPLVENAPLARALNKGVQVGQEIPSHLYEAVASVLAFVYSLKTRVGDNL